MYILFTYDTYCLQWLPTRACACRQNLLVVLSKKLQACAKYWPFASLHTLDFAMSRLQPSS